MTNQDPQYDGLTLLGTSKAPAQKKLETFPAPQQELDYVIFEAPEFTSMCPITGQPDFAHVTIMYKPDEKCLESKSLKLYLQTFRSEGAFNEALTAQIAQDLLNVLDAFWVTVTIRQNPRGGIGLTSSVTLTSSSWKDDDEKDPASPNGHVQIPLPLGVREDGE